MFELLFILALAIGAISFGIYAHGHGKLGMCIIGLVLLLNPITGPICWVILGIAVVGAVLKNAGLAEWWAGENGERL